MPILAAAFVVLRPFLIKAAVLVPIAVVNTIVTHYVKRALIRRDKKKDAKEAEANITPFMF